MRSIVSHPSFVVAGLLIGTGVTASSMFVHGSVHASPAGARAPAESAETPAESPLEEQEHEQQLEEQAQAPASAPSTCGGSTPVVTLGCEIDMTDPVNPLWPCALPGITIESWNGSGLTLRVDMDAAGALAPNGEWDMLQVVGSTDGLSGYALNIGNSRSNNAWAGDSGHTDYDAEMHLYNSGLWVWHGDMAGSGQALQIGNAVSSSGGYFEATVCDGRFTWESDTTAPTTVVHPDSIFQLRSPADSVYYVSFNQVVDGPYRSGSGIEPYPYLLLSAF